MNVFKSLASGETRPSWEGERGFESVNHPSISLKGVLILAHQARARQNAQHAPFLGAAQDGEARCIVLAEPIQDHIERVVETDTGKIR